MSKTRNYSKTASHRNRQRTRKQSRFIIVLVAVLCCIIVLPAVILTVLHPVGIFEYFSYLSRTSGQGDGYSIDITGGKPYYALSNDNTYLLVNDSSVNAYNLAGKIIFERPHSFSKPVVKFGDTRYILYGQGEKELSVNTVDETLYSLSFDGGVLCADISQSGVFAVATKTEGYDSSVAVFDKKNKKIYEWFSSDETINSVKLSKNGKNLAVATIKVEDGSFVSSLYVLEYNSANPISKRVYNDDVIYSLTTPSSNIFCVATSSTVSFLNFKKDTDTSFSDNYGVSLVKDYKGRTVVVRSLAENQEESLVQVYSPSAKQLLSFIVSTSVTDCSYKSGNLYLLDNSKIYKYNSKGKLVAEADIEFDSLYIEAISNNDVALIRNSVVEKCNLARVGD